jgi:hypothetical protein
MKHGYQRSALRVLWPHLAADAVEFPIDRFGQRESHIIVDRSIGKSSPEEPVYKSCIEVLVQ